MKQVEWRLKEMGLLVVSAYAKTYHSLLGLLHSSTYAATVTSLQCSLSNCTITSNASSQIESATWEDVFVLVSDKPESLHRPTAKASPALHPYLLVTSEKARMAHSHSHSRDHGHDHAEHDHSHDLEPALQSSLYSKIAFEEIITLNEFTPKSGAAIVKKEWNQRLDDSLTLNSDADEQLLMHVP